MSDFVAPRWGTERSDAKSKGELLSKVASALGFDLFKWQQYVADVSLETNDQGNLKYKTVSVLVGRQNGKTALACARIAYQLLYPKQIVAFTAQDRSMAKNKWLEHVELILSSTLANRVSRVAYANGSECLYMENGSQYRIVTPNRKGARGLTLDLVLIDEGLTHTMEVISALQPTLATRTNGQLWILSNAGDENSTMLSHYRNLGHQETTEETRLAYFEWGPHEDKFDPLSTEVWHQAIPTLSEAGGVNLEAVAEAAQTTPPDLFSREWLNVWQSLESTQVIDLPTWEALEKPDILVGDNLCLGVDVAPNRDYATIGACSKQGAWYPVEIIDHRATVGWVHDRIVELCKKWKCPVVIDGGGPAGNLIINLEREGIQVIAIGMRDFARSCTSFYDGVQEGTVAHLGDRILQDAVLGASRRNLAESWAWARRSEIPITPLVSVTLARWGVVAAHSPIPVPAIY